tara:strand:+ start:100 stop:792 length:693 start_codon:yes stop_codon:yes gene_type:complete
MICDLLLAIGQVERLASLNNRINAKQIKKQYDRNNRINGINSDIRSTEVSSFLKFQYVIGLMDDSDPGKKSLKAKNVEKTRITKNVEEFIDNNREELFNKEPETDEEGRITHHYSTNEVVETIFNENRDHRDITYENERKIKLAMKWKPKHIIVKGKIFEITAIQNRVDMTRSSTHTKQNVKFNCFFINNSDFSRFEKNQGSFCDVACDNITDEEKELENTLLLKIESES